MKFQKFENNLTTFDFIRFSIGMHGADSTTMYTQLNDNIERGSEILYLIVARISFVGCVIPHLLLTIVNYSVHDMGDESYVLPFLMT